MNLRRIAFAGVSAVALIGATLGFIPGAQASSVPAKNATVVCGSACSEVSGQALGSSFVLNARQSGPWLNLRAFGNARSNEDFKLRDVTTTGLACSQGFFPGSSYQCSNNTVMPSNTPVFEAAFTPNGNSTGVCAGTDGVTAFLAACGQTNATTLMWDTHNRVGSYSPLISGANTNFSDPLALSVNPSSTAFANRLRFRPEVVNGGVVVDTQMFRVNGGPTTPLPTTCFVPSSQNGSDGAQVDGNGLALAASFQGNIVGTKSPQHCSAQFYTFNPAGVANNAKVFEFAPNGHLTGQVITQNGSNVFLAPMAGVTGSANQQWVATSDGSGFQWTNGNNTVLQTNGDTNVVTAVPSPLAGGNNNEFNFVTTP